MINYQKHTYFYAYFHEAKINSVFFTYNLFCPACYYQAMRWNIMFLQAAWQQLLAAIPPHSQVQSHFGFFQVLALEMKTLNIGFKKITFSTWDC